MGIIKKGAGLVAVSTMAATALTLVPQTSTAASSTAQASTVASAAVTNFGFVGSAYGSRVRGGDLPANSGRTALAVIGCTRETGRLDRNTLATVNLGNLATVNGIESKTRTYRRGGSVNVKSTNKIARVRFGNADGLNLGNDLVLEGVRSTARAWHDANGFHRKGGSSLARILFAGIEVPITGNLVDVPGVATITLSDRSGSKSRMGASISVKAVKVDLDLTDSNVTLGVANAKIMNGFRTGVLGGVGIAAKGSLVDGLVRTGRVARQPLPCRGTNGEWRTNRTAGVTVNGLVHLGAATASARGNQRSRTSGYAQTRGRVARATVGGNDGLVIKGVVGGANVTKKGDKLVKTAKGTRILSITFNGRDRNSPTLGNPVRIGNLAVLTAPRVKKTRFGISVVSLRIELLRGIDAGSTVDLGIAKASIKPF